MTQQGGQQRAREEVLRRMAELGLSQRRMSSEVGISTNTIARFLSAESWPRTHQIASMERALNWPAGAIEAIANGADVPRTEEKTPDRVAHRAGSPTLGHSQEAAGVIVALGPWADGMTDLERAAYEAEVQAYALRLAVEWEEKSRTRRDEPAQQ